MDVTCDVTMAMNSLKLALGRWQDTASEKNESMSDPNLVRFASVGEALQWASSLDDYWSTFHAKHEHITTKFCNNKMLDGLHFARNRVVHGLITTVSGYDGLTFPLKFPLRFAQYQWRPASELPLPVKGIGSGTVGQRQREAYANSWQGADVGITLKTLVTHFDELAG